MVLQFHKKFTANTPRRVRRIFPHTIALGFPVPYIFGQANKVVTVVTITRVRICTRDRSVLLLISSREVRYPQIGFTLVQENYYLITSVRSTGRKFKFLHPDLPSTLYIRYLGYYSNSLSLVQYPYIYLVTNRPFLFTSQPYVVCGV